MHMHTNSTSVLGVPNNHPEQYNTARSPGGQNPASILLSAKVILVQLPYDVIKSNPRYCRVDLPPGVILQVGMNNLDAPLLVKTLAILAPTSEEGKIRGETLILGYLQNHKSKRNNQKTIDLADVTTYLSNQINIMGNLEGLLAIYEQLILQLINEERAAVVPTAEKLFEISYSNQKKDHKPIYPMSILFSNLIKKCIKLADSNSLQNSKDKIIQMIAKAIIYYHGSDDVYLAALELLQKIPTYDNSGCKRIDLLLCEKIYSEANKNNVASIRVVLKLRQIAMDELTKCFSDQEKVLPEKILADTGIISQDLNELFNNFKSERADLKSLTKQISFIIQNFCASIEDLDQLYNYTISWIQGSEDPQERLFSVNLPHSKDPENKMYPMSMLLTNFITKYNSFNANDKAKEVIRYVIYNFKLGDVKFYTQALGALVNSDQETKELVEIIYVLLRACGLLTEKIKTFMQNKLYILTDGKNYEIYKFLSPDHKWHSSNELDEFAKLFNSRKNLFNYPLELPKIFKSDNLPSSKAHS